nr:uncharacterized protein LOC115257213 [Aedes albopictus]
MRYSTIELDSAAYDYITGGNSSYNFKASNMHMPAVKTLKHHISGYTMDTKEGVVMVQPLLNYLISHQYPMVVTLSEDGTALSPNIEYDPRNDSLRGLVAPLDSNGMPVAGVFTVKSLRKIISDLENHRTADYVYVVMATPMVVGAAPICIFYMCTDNRFTSDDVTARWLYVERVLWQAGITTVAVSSDGDSRLLKAMKNRSRLPNTALNPLYGPYYVAGASEQPICVQDTVHLINKLRNALLDPKRHMRLGKHYNFR